MAVEGKHVSANLRFYNSERETVQTLHRIRPNIQGSDAETLVNAIQQIRALPLAAVSMTRTTELVSV